MINGLMKNLGATAKWLIGAGFIGALLLVAAMRGCTSDLSTNKHDAVNTKTIVGGNIEMQKLKDAKETAIAEQIAIEANAEAAAKTKMRTSDNETAVELKRTLDVTEIENKKLDMQDKAILDVNKQADREFELEKMKIQLLEAEKIKNDLKIKEMEMANETARKNAEAESRAKAEKAKADAVRATANANAAKVKAAAAEKARKEKEEIEILKMIAQ